MSMEITPLTQEQLTELETLKSQQPKLTKKLESYFNKNARAYRDHNIYGIGLYFSRDVWQLARYFEYQQLKTNNNEN